MPRLWSVCLVPAVLMACVEPTVTPGSIEGSPRLFPDGCTQSADRVCFVSDPIRYVPAATGQMWRTTAYDETSRPLGTTDGASIPEAVWGLIGGPYAAEFIRPAILHDNYTWPENRIRPWRDTHRAFLYALLDEGVEPTKAYVMYYAVYAFGGHWGELVRPEDCDEGCEYRGVPPSGLSTLNRNARDQGGIDIADFVGTVANREPTTLSDAAAADIRAVWPLINGNTIVTSDVETTLRNIEEMARRRHPENAFLDYVDCIPLTPENIRRLGL